MAKKKIAGNYLDMIPVYAKDCTFVISEKGEVTILVENKGFFNRIAQKCFGKPKISQIHLDRMGNFIWPLLDGTRSVYEIAESVKEEFGEKAQPLYPRLVQYLRNLQAYGFVTLEAAGSKSGG